MQLVLHPHLYPQITRYRLVESRNNVHEDMPHAYTAPELGRCLDLSSLSKCLVGLPMSACPDVGDPGVHCEGVVGGS